ncbi:MAG TPA: RluA family pseudouridine synthase [Alphaproteobacteria bacterium]|nr:RluA family pseudouridine synthase [Alphaproteobacteria bacterium]
MSDETQTIKISIPEDTPPMRLDKALAILHPDLSRSRLKSLILSGDVIVSGYIVKTASYKVSSKDEIIISVPVAVEDTPRAQNIPLDIVYEDDDLLVINKAVGMVVHPGAGNHEDTLVNALLHHCKGNLSGIGGVKRPGIVHRLDKETSGLMVVAKNDLAHQGLSDQLQDRTLSRIYSALVWRVPTLIKGSVDMPIGRHSSNRLKMAIMMSSGRPAVTHYHVQEKYGEAASWVSCKLESGRTHQIRVHMQHIKHPLVGDPLYGLVYQEGRALLKKAGYEADIIDKIMAYDRQALHAQEIGFIHPRTGAEMSFSSDLPEDLQNLKNLFKTIG